MFRRLDGVGQTAAGSSVHSSSPLRDVSAPNLHFGSDPSYIWWQPAKPEGKATPKLITLHRVLRRCLCPDIAAPKASTSKFIARHTHPGPEMTYLWEGEATLVVDGQPTQAMQPRVWLQVTAEVPH